MKKSQYSAEQIIKVLEQASSGTPVDELCRKCGISRATFYNWRKQFSGMDKTMVRDYRQTKQENGRLKKMVAELMLDKEGSVQIFWDCAEFCV